MAKDVVVSITNNLNDDLMDMSLSTLWEMAKDRVAWHTVVHGVTRCKTQLSD